MINNVLWVNPPTLYASEGLSWPLYKNEYSRKQINCLSTVTGWGVDSMYPNQGYNRHLLR